MATTDLKLQAPGTLASPGMIGRLTRLVFGLLCVLYVYKLLSVTFSLLDSQQHIRPLLWNGLLPALFLVSYVINIGYSRHWRKWPAFISALILAAAALVGFLIDGVWESALLARTLWLWEMYLFLHLGLSFVLAAILATPGCEMRAFFHLFSIITGKPRHDHQCPIGPLRHIDDWESNHRSY